MKKQLEIYVSPESELIIEYREPFDKKEIHKYSVQSLDLQKKIYSFYKNDPIEAYFYLGMISESILFSVSIQFWKKISKKFIDQLRLNQDMEQLRHKLKIEIPKDFLQNMLEEIPFFQGSEYLTYETLATYWKNLNLFYQSKMKKHRGSVEDFFYQYAKDIHLLGKIFFHLVENKNDPEFPFAFLATYASSIDNKGGSQHRPLKYALVEYEDDSSQMLKLMGTVNKISKSSHLLKDLVESGDIFHPLSWSSKQAYLFLKEVPIFEDAGILCRIPDWWKKKDWKSNVNISLGEKSVSGIDANSLVDFKIDIVLDGDQISIKEAQKLLSQSEGLAFIKGKWIAVDHKELASTIESWDKAQKLMKDRDITLSEALRFLMSIDNHTKNLIGNDEYIQTSCGQWLESLLSKMKNPQLIKRSPPPKELKATLRPYQQKGLDWLMFMHSLGFGACLADDMGLGKTIQVIAFIKKIVKHSNNSTKNSSNLLIIPASLLGNWMQEIEKFCPSLKFMIAHSSSGQFKKLHTLNSDVLNGFDLIITTYAMVKKSEILQKHLWNYIFLDEAQAIKNPQTLQTKTIKKLISHNRIALTGTPVENRLNDLWSLFDFLNPGLLGTNKEFALFNKELNNDSKKFSSLRKVISPYILRRLKTDKNIISDLPDKIELDTFSKLSSKQVVLYQQLVNNIKEELESSAGIKRKGIILSSLTKFKQICNHPDQYLGSGAYKEQESGKFQRLKEICETIREKREKVLIFTQFREITKPLDNFLAEIFGAKGLVLHGGTPIKKRKVLVEKFQQSNYVPYFILSVKAGGTGLNLTAASHVVHFDRWWNPSVENQATDRAFRIGQKNSVLVHKFISKGTIEEKIANMIEEKKELSENVLSSSGAEWITELNNEEIINLFKIDNEAYLA